MPARCWQYAGMQQDERHHDIDLQPLIDALAGPLALIDSPERRADIQRFLEMGRVHLERALIDLLSRLVGLIGDAGGPPARVEWRAGRPVLVISTAPAAASTAEEEEPEELFTVEGDMEKVTIRIPAELKDLISQAASLRGLSVNSWYVRELARSISRGVREQVREDMRSRRREARQRRGGSSLRGFVGD
jgi:hypothetical protein